MLHLRTDWAGIQDQRQLVTDQECHELGECCTCCSDEQTHEGSSIHSDEPVFVLRAKDPCSAATVRRYAQLASAAGSDPEFCLRIMQWADQMEAYAATNFKVKHRHAPDAPEMLPTDGINLGEKVCIGYD